MSLPPQLVIPGCLYSLGPAASHELRAGQLSGQSSVPQWPGFGVDRGTGLTRSEGPVALSPCAPMWLDPPSWSWDT